MYKKIVNKLYKRHYVYNNNNNDFYWNKNTKYSKKGKVFYGHEPLSGESTTTECGANY